jgi:hypothetical protein
VNAPFLAAANACVRASLSFDAPLHPFQLPIDFLALATAGGLAPVAAGGEAGGVVEAPPPAPGDAPVPLDPEVVPDDVPGLEDATGEPFLEMIPVADVVEDSLELPLQPTIESSSPHAAAERHTSRRRAHRFVGMREAAIGEERVIKLYPVTVAVRKRRHRSRWRIGTDQEGEQLYENRDMPKECRPDLVRSRRRVMRTRESDG